MMKRFFNYTLALVLVGYMVPTMPRGPRDPFGGLRAQMGNLENQGHVRRMAEQLRRELENAQAAEAQRQQNLRAAARQGDQVAMDDIASSRRKEELLQAKGVDVLGQVAGLYVNAANAGIRMAENEQQAEQRLQEEVGKAAVNAKANKEASIVNLKQKLDWVKEPKNLATVAGGVGLTVLAGYGAYQSLLFLSEYVRHLYRNPILAQETSLLSLSEKMGQFFMGKKIEPKKLSDVIMTPEVEQQMTVIDSALKKAVVTDDFLFNMLIWGPPGTGKTMMAQRLARSSGLDFIYFSGSSLDQFSLEEALIKLHELFEYPKKTGKKMVIIIDEAERLLGKRSPSMPEKTAKILTDILTYLGTETSDYMAVALTNRPEDLDEAFLSRCDYRLYVGAPDQTQRARIIKKYMTDYLLSTPPATRVPTLASRLWSVFSKPKPKQRIAVAPDAVNDAAIQEIARLTDGFVGRDLSKMVFEMRRRAQVSPNKTLTKAMVDEVVARKCKEHAQQDGGFKRQDVQVRTTRQVRKS